MGPAATGAVNRIIHIDFRKWPDSLHWQFDMFHLGEDQWGTWLWSPPGTTARRGSEEPKSFNHTNVKLIRPVAWWSAIWNDGAHYDLYVDVISPAIWDGDTVTMVDLDLDVERTVNGDITILDEDEFAEHQVVLQYPAHLIAGARKSADDVADMLRSRQEPFYAAGENWKTIAKTLG